MCLTQPLPEGSPTGSFLLNSTLNNLHLNDSLELGAPFCPLERGRFYQVAKFYVNQDLN